MRPGTILGGGVQPWGKGLRWSENSLKNLSYRLSTAFTYELKEVYRDLTSRQFIQLNLSDYLVKNLVLKILLLLTICLC